MAPSSSEIDILISLFLTRREVITLPQLLIISDSLNIGFVLSIDLTRREVITLPQLLMTTDSSVNVVFS
jgi:predicted nucleotidyltransferase